jgi:hypothetical protein
MSRQSHDRDAYLEKRMVCGLLCHRHIRHPVLLAAAAKANAVAQPGTRSSHTSHSPIGWPWSQTSEGPISPEGGRSGMMELRLELEKAIAD